MFLSFAQSPEKQREKANADLRIKDAKLEAAEAENAVLRLQAHELENTKSSQSTLIEALKKQLEKSTTVIEIEYSNTCTVLD